MQAAGAGGALPDGGSPSSLQVMYFSSLFPYVVLACFLVRGLLLRGAVDGILHMFTPKVRAGVPVCQGNTDRPTGPGQLHIREDTLSTHCMWE